MEELKIMLLKYIHKMSCLELHDIETHFSKYDSVAIRRTLDNMYLQDNTIDLKETSDKIHSIISISDEGRVQATNLIIRSNLTQKEIWKERICGATAGILASVISGSLLWLITG